MVALRGETSTLNLEVWTVNRDDSRWKVASISEEKQEHHDTCIICHDVFQGVRGSGGTSVTPSEFYPLKQG